MNEREFTFRVRRVKEGTKDEAVLDFLRSRNLMPMRELLLLTMKMCWLPFSYRYQGMDFETQRNAAREAVYQLEHHLNYLVETFDLEQPQLQSNGAFSQQTSVEQEEQEVEYDVNDLGF
ncbi:MAG: hypothetical protein GVY17_14465 [Cyanobacteria bacterium]|nr:hypothetical protein [Cyanobacteria bacterium GSL.Bin21]